MKDSLTNACLNTLLLLFKIHNKFLTTQYPNTIVDHYSRVYLCSCLCNSSFFKTNSNFDLF